MRTAQILTGVTMAAFLAAPMFGGNARRVRMVVAGFYLTGVVVFVLYVLF
jgi:hypothetical protein